MTARPVLFALLLTVAACAGTPCPPNQPCTEPDGGATFACGSSQCTSTQLCVVPATCADPPTYTSEGAVCVDLPAACTDARTQCGCEAEIAAGGDGGSPTTNVTPQCCFFAGWVPESFNICTIGCA